MDSDNEGPWTRSPGPKAEPVYKCLPSKVHGLEGRTQYITREGDRVEGRHDTEIAAQHRLTKSLP